MPRGRPRVLVSLAPDGTVTDTTILESSGYPVLDNAALATTRATKFRPEIRDCIAIAGSYVYAVNFPE
jgi:TonB family protein